MMQPLDSLHPRSASRTSASRRKSTSRHFLLSTRKAMLLSAITVAAGIGYSLHTADWNWFARSGSVVVIIGLFLTSSQIIDNCRKLRNRRSWTEHNFTRDFADDIKRDSLQRVNNLDEAILENGLHGLYLLVTGTLIWGFGDLLGLLLGMA